MPGTHGACRWKLHRSRQEMRRKGTGRMAPGPCRKQAGRQLSKRVRLAQVQIKKVNVLAMQNEDSKPQSFRPSVSPFD